MNLQSRSREEPEVNLTSLIDVVLLLLVFFMVSTSFVREAEISLRLPEATGDPPAETTESLAITITTNGSYLVNDRPLVNNESATLRAAIIKLIGERREMPVIIRADAQSTHQAVVTAMDVAGRLGFIHINLATMSDQE